MGRMEKIWERLWRKKKRRGSPAEEEAGEGGEEGSDKENEVDVVDEALRGQGVSEGGEGGFLRKRQDLGDERPQRVVVTAAEGKSPLSYLIVKLAYR